MKKTNEKNQVEMNVAETVAETAQRELREALEAEERELAEIEAQMSSGKGTIGRKEQVLAILSDGEEHTIEGMSKALGIKPTNVSSQLSYLKADGWAITTGRTSSHKKVLLKNGVPRNLKIEREELINRKKALGLTV